MKKYIKYLPNFVTCTSMMLAFMAYFILLHTFLFKQESVDLSHVIKLILSVLCLTLIADLLDGRIARYFHVESVMGKKLDSFHDLLIFGVIVALTYYTFLLKDAPIILASFSLSSYICACAWRLACFETKEHDTWFSGVPTTYTGAILIWFCCFSFINVDISLYFLLVVPMLCAFLMLMPFPCMSFGYIMAVFPNKVCAYFAMSSWILSIILFFFLDVPPYAQMIVSGSFVCFYLFTAIFQFTKWILLGKNEMIRRESRKL